MLMLVFTFKNKVLQPKSMIIQNLTIVATNDLATGGCCIFSFSFLLSTVQYAREGPPLFVIEDTATIAVLPGAK